MPTFGSLFAGIGGIDLGLERAGWTGRWQVEWDPFCQHVLAHHWPDIPRYGDITTVDWTTVEPVDLIAGGFPCQPFSVAGRRQGVADDRWLWPEFARAVRVLRPSLVLVENVPGLLAGHGGMGHVLGDLAGLGYDAEWDSIPATAVGAPHLRYRVWIVAYRAELGRAVADADIWRPFDPLRAGWDAARDGGTDVAYADGERQGRAPALGSSSLAGSRPEDPSPEPHGAGARTVPDTDSSGCAVVPWRAERAERLGVGAALGGGGQGSAAMADTTGGRQPRQGEPLDASHPETRGDGQAVDALDGGVGGQWAVEPDVGRVAHGVPARVDRLRALGNAVVPQVVEVIGRGLLEALA